MKTKRLLGFILAFVCMQFLTGCSSADSEWNRENLILDESGDSLRVDIGNDIVINFLMTVSSEIDEDTAISIRDIIEIDSVLWYHTNTYTALKLTIIG